MPRARDVGSVIAGEAVSGTPQERWNDMVHIASVIANRAQALGVTPQEVIANTNEFNAYNRAMPPGTADLTDMANAAMNYVEVNGPVNNATFYATPAATDNLPSGLLAETATTGHQYFSDPQNRAIGTALGYRQPNEYAFAANPENVPTPDQPGLMAGTGDIGQGWAINGVAPALGPTVEGWSSMASATPVSAPMGSVTASGLLGGNPDLSASAVAAPMGLLSGVPDTSNFDMSRFGPTATPDTAGFDMSRFGPASTEGFDQARFGAPSIDPATNTQSFMDAPSVNAPASGLLASVPAMEASATVPSLQSSYVAPVSVTPAEQAVNSIATPGLSPSQIDGYQQAAKTMAQAGMLNIGQQPPTDLSGNLPTNFNVLSSPALETVSVPEQPTIAGPASAEITPALDQQQQVQTQQAVNQVAAPQQAAKTTLGDKLKASINPGSVIGGLLGGAALGPIGGLLGALAGNAVNNGSFSGLLSSQAPTMTNYGFNPGVVGGIYGGGYAPGSTATASDGSRVSAQAGGDVARTNGFGVTDVSNSYGGYAGDFSGWY